MRPTRHLPSLESLEIRTAPAVVIPGILTGAAAILEMLPHPATTMEFPIDESLLVTVPIR